MKRILLTMAIAAAAYSSNAQILASQNFESGVHTPWTEAHTGVGGAGWQIKSVPTNMYFSVATTNGKHTKYAIVDEYNTPNNATATLTSPVFSLSGVTTPYLGFDYLYFGASLSAAPYTHEAAWIEFTTDGTSWVLLDSFTAVGSGAAWTTKFIALPTSSSATCQVRFQYKDNGGNLVGVALDEILVYGAPATDVGITSVTPVSGAPNSYFLVPTGSASFAGSVTNYGTGSISSITANYQVGTSPVVTATVPVSLAGVGATGTFTIPTPYTVATIGQKSVKVWISATGDANLKNDSMNTAIVGVPFLPKKRVLFEEATGTWCGWCPRGMIYMDSLWKLHQNDVCITSVHNGGSDPMKNDNNSAKKYDGLIASLVGGFPSMVVDRTTETDPSNAFSAYNVFKDLFGYVNIGVTATYTGSAVNATATVQPALDLTGDYRLEFFITEDDVVGSGTGWSQTNYYAPGGPGNSTSMKNAKYNFNILPSPASGLSYPFVARYTVPADVQANPNGIASSLPAAMRSGGVYTYSITPVTIPSNWVSTKLRVNVSVIDNNSSSATFGRVLNSTHTSVTTPWAFINVGAEVTATGINDVQLFPNPAANDAHMRFVLQDATTVQFSVFDVAGREVFSAPAEKMLAGGHQINFSTAGYASGLYNVVLTTETGKVTQRLSVVK